MRDAIDMELAGIPSVAIVHEDLQGSADSMKRLSGMPDYPYVVVENPHITLCVWPQEEIDQVARQIAPKIAALLTRGSRNQHK